MSELTPEQRAEADAIHKTEVLNDRLLAHLQVAARELAELSWFPPDEATMSPTDEDVREVLRRFLRGEVVLANES